MPQPPKGPGDQLTMRGSLNLLFIVATSVSKCGTPFIRDRIGSKAQGFSIAVVGVVLFYVANLTADEFVLYYFVVWLLAVVNQRLTSAKFRKSNQVHSHYSGRPWLANFLGCKDEGTARLVVEPLACFAAGFVLSQWSLNLGKLIGCVGVALLLLELMHRRVTEEREQAVVDAWIESEQLERGVRDRLGF